MTPDALGSSPNQLNTVLWPRQRRQLAGIAASPAVGVSPRNVQVLKTWTHIVRPYDNFSVQNQNPETAGSGGGPQYLGLSEYTAGSIGGEKIIQRKKFFKFNQKMLMNATATGATPVVDDGFFPAYYLMYYCDYEDANSYATTPAGSANPRIALSLRINYMDV